VTSETHGTPLHVLFCSDAVLVSDHMGGCAGSVYELQEAHQSKAVSTSLLPPQIAKHAWWPSRRACHAISLRTSARNAASRGYLQAPQEVP